MVLFCLSFVVDVRFLLMIPCSGSVIPRMYGAGITALFFFFHMRFAFFFIFVNPLTSGFPSCRDHHKWNVSNTLDDAFESKLLNI